MLEVPRDVILVVSKHTLNYPNTTSKFRKDLAPVWNHGKNHSHHRSHNLELQAYCEFTPSHHVSKHTYSYRETFRSTSGMYPDGLLQISNLLMLFCVRSYVHDSFQFIFPFLCIDFMLIQFAVKHSIECATRE